MRKEAAEKDCRSVRSIRGIRRVSGRARAEPGCQTSPKECIKIVENSGERVRKKPQSRPEMDCRRVRPQKDCRSIRSIRASEGFQGGRAEPGCQTSPKECIKILEQ